MADDIRTALELAILSVLRDAAGLAGVKTFENSVRDCLFTGENLTQGFRPEELPAIAVSAQLKPTVKAQFSVSETGWTIPVSLTIVTKAQRGKLAAAAAAGLQDAVDVVLGAFRKSGNGLGTNTLLMGDVSSSATVIDEKPYSFGISTTDFSILKVVGT